MVYANMVNEYYESESLGEYSRNIGYWRGAEKEYGIMRAEDKAVMDDAFARQEYRERRALDNQLLEDPIHDVYFGNQYDDVGPYKPKPLPDKVREHKMALLRRYMKRMGMGGVGNG